MLRERGRAAANDFLATHRNDLGKRSSLDLDSLLEGA
jgi:NTE family protein